jgi:hypothetical protein
MIANSVKTTDETIKQIKKELGNPKGTEGK